MSHRCSNFLRERESKTFSQWNRFIETINQLKQPALSRLGCSVTCENLESAQLARCIHCALFWCSSFLNFKLTNLITDTKGSSNFGRRLRPCWDAWWRFNCWRLLVTNAWCCLGTVPHAEVAPPQWPWKAYLEGIWPGQRVGLSSAVPAAYKSTRIQFYQFRVEKNWLASLVSHES